MSSRCLGVIKQTSFQSNDASIIFVLTIEQEIEFRFEKHLNSFNQGADKKLIAHRKLSSAPSRSQSNEKAFRQLILLKYLLEH